MSDELTVLSEETAREARSYLAAVTEVASGASPDTAIPVLLLAVSQVLVVGARLGAITDVVPDERFEADPGPEADVDPLRQGLANLFEGLDEYAHVVDPLVGVEIATGSLSNDLAEVAAALAHGLQHRRRGRRPARHRPPRCHRHGSRHPSGRAPPRLRALLARPSLENEIRERHRPRRRRRARPRPRRHRHRRERARPRSPLHRDPAASLRRPG